MKQEQPEEGPFRKTYLISRDGLPLHCPTPEMSLWDAHPRVFLAIEEARTADCPYCGTHFILQE